MIFQYIPRFTLNEFIWHDHFGIQSIEVWGCVRENVVNVFNYLNYTRIDPRVECFLHTWYLLRLSLIAFIVHCVFVFVVTQILNQFWTTNHPTLQCRFIHSIAYHSTITINCTSHRPIKMILCLKISLRTSFVTLISMIASSSGSAWQSPSIIFLECQYCPSVAMVNFQGWIILLEFLF